MNIFVAKLNYSLGDADLKELFGQYGDVKSAKVIMDRETGRSKGFGFVEMFDEPSGQAAIDALNGQEVEGHRIVVKKAEPRGDAPKRDFGGGGGGFGGGGGGGRREGGFGGNRDGGGGGERRRFDRDGDDDYNKFGGGGGGYKKRY